MSGHRWYGAAYRGGLDPASPLVPHEPEDQSSRTRGIAMACLIIKCTRRLAAGTCPAASSRK